MSRDLTLYIQSRNKDSEQWKWFNTLEWDNMYHWWCYNSLQGIYELESCRELDYADDSEGYDKLDFGLTWSFGYSPHKVFVKDVLDNRVQLVTGHGKHRVGSGEWCLFMVELIAVLGITLKFNPDKEFRLVFGQW